MFRHFLEASDISKTIKGRTIIRKTSFEMRGGRVYGLKGDNGSGKTMLLRLLCGLSNISSGKVMVDGIDIIDKKATYNRGIVIETSFLWPHLRGIDNLRYLAGLNNRIGNDDIADAMLRVGLDPGNQLAVKKYSLGMRQRLLIAQAIMEKPDFLFLDEPTNSLDRTGVLLIRKIIAEEAERGAAVILSSHINQDVSDLCDEVYLLSNGRVERV